MTVQTWRESLRETFDESDEADPHVIAAAAADRMSRRQLLDAAGDLMPDAVREMIRSQRSYSPPEQGSSRWQATSEMTKTPQRMREYVPGVGWKFRDVLTASDCRMIAEFYQLQADTNQAQADVYTALAERIEAAGVETVGDLDDAAAVEAAA